MLRDDEKNQFSPVNLVELNVDEIFKAENEDYLNKLKPMPDLNLRTIKNMNQFIDIMKRISKNEKKQVKFTSVGNKDKINNFLTTHLNDLFIAKRLLLQEFLYSITELFKDFDSTEFQERTLHEHEPIVINDIVDKNEYTIEKNKFKNITNNNITNNNTTKGYFVFKGGNVIKYWTLKKYLEKLTKIHNDSIIDILNEKINVTDSDVFNSTSDYDFQYYISAGEEEYNLIYNNLIDHILRRIILLRTELTIMFNDKTVDSFDEKEEDITNGVFDEEKKKIYIEDLFNEYYIKGFGKIKRNSVNNNDEVIIQKSNKVSSIIVTKIMEKITDENRGTIKIDEDGRKSYSFLLALNEENANMNISFNNSIRTLVVDFDLFRIKLKYDIENDYIYDSFASELFDLTVLRPCDKDRINFCNNINKNTNIVNRDDNSPMRVYSIIYLLKDLLTLLFISNNPHDTIFIWKDIKYEKRIIRLGFLYASYLDELKNIVGIKKIEDIIKEANIVIKNNAYIYLLNFFVGMFILHFIYYFKKKVHLFKAEKKSARIYTYTSLIRRVYFELKYFMGKLNFDSILIEEIIKHIDKIVNDYNNNDLGTLSTASHRDLVETYVFLDFMLATYLLYVKAIFIDKDAAWCTENFDKIPYPNIIMEFEVDALKFMELFGKYFIIGLQAQTNIIDNLIDWISDDLTLNGGRIKNSNKYDNLMKSNSEKSYEVIKGSRSQKNNIVKKLEDNNFFKNLNKYIKYAENFYEYNEENKFTEYIHRSNQFDTNYNKSINYKLEIIPKTFKKDCYYNENNFDKYMLKQDKLVNNIFDDDNIEDSVQGETKNIINSDLDKINYYDKYAKYKNKYLKLKKKI